MRQPFVALLLFALTVAVSRSTADSAVDAWLALDERRLEDAARLFTQARRDGDTSARTTYGLALARLNAQPRTRGTLDNARATFAAVTTDHPGTEEGIRARYFLARIDQIHAYTPNPVAARTAFLALLTDHPDHLFAQLGLAKVADIDLYDPTLSPADRLARFEQLSARSPALTHWPARRDFHQFMAQAALYFDLPLPLAQTHLMAALDAGFSSAINRANILFRAAEVARALDDAALAHRLYDEFVTVLPRDARARLARERRDALTPLPSS